MQLGRESISSSNTAIIELVKNAYDADAERVTIRFAGLGTNNPRMLVEDNGDGMNETELREFWLCIGTTNKQQAIRSNGKKRVQTGEKGLGRLGLDRLCHRTLLQSLKKPDTDSRVPTLFPEQKETAVELDIRWDQYKAAGRRLETIEHGVNLVEHLNFDPLTIAAATFPHGTRLVLEGLKDEWTRGRISELCAELALLLSPFGRPEDFSIVVDSGCNWPDVDGPVLPPADLLALANWKVEAQIFPVLAVGPDGKVSVATENVSIKMTSSAHERAFIREPMPWSEFTKHKTPQGLEAGQPRSRCGPLRFDFYVFIRDAEELAKRGSGLSEIADFLLANRGVRIYRDGFRVKPYGDPVGQNDWLTLSLRRATNPAAISRPNWKVAYHQVGGAVFVSREANQELIDPTNREGLVEGQAFDDLRLFADKVIQYFEGRAHEDSIAQEPRKPAHEPAADAEAKATAALEQIGDAIKDLTRQVTPPNAPDPTKVIEESVAKAQAEITRMHAETDARLRAQEARLGAMEAEMGILMSLASLGIMTASFGHERVNDATEVLNDAARLRAYVKDPQGSLFTQSDQLAMLDHLVSGAQRIDAFAKFALDHIRPRKREKDLVKLRQLVEDTLKVFDELLTGRFHAKVTTHLPADDPCEVMGWAAGWESVLVNFITNSSWALGPKSAADRKILVTVERDDNDVVLRFEDSGIGLEAGTEEDIFRPGVSTKRDDHGRVIGTGMGLAIVQSFVTRNRGTVRAVAHSALGGAGFEVRVPRVEPKPA
jgi:signal transduction histidine kinase